MAKREFGLGFISHSSMPTKNGLGGTMQLIRGSSAGRHIRNGRDRYGRFSWIDIQGKNDKKACIITAYRVTQSKGTRLSALKATPHIGNKWQQWLKMDMWIRTPEIRSWRISLTKFMDSKQEQGYEMLLMIDGMKALTRMDQKYKNLSKSIHCVTYMQNSSHKCQLPWGLAAVEGLTTCWPPMASITLYEKQGTMHCTKALFPTM